MNKTSLIEILTKSSEELKRVLDDAEDLLSKSGGKTLNLKTIRGQTYLFSYSKETGKQKLINHSDTNQVKTLASAYYGKKLIPVAKRQKKQIDSCITILNKDSEISDVDKVFDGLPDVIRENVDISELTSEGYARKWQDGNSYVRKFRTRSKDDYHKYKTLRGDYVGSKSELIIADRLYVEGIPYHYEIAFTPEAQADKSRPVYDELGMVIGYESLGSSPFDQDTLHPDFYVLNKRTQKAYFWEHLGKMDDAEYCKKNFNRFLRILDAGYVIGEDLIVTHEDTKHPLMTESIDMIIERYLR